MSEEQKGADNTPQEGEGAGEQQLIAGKFKTQEEFENAYKELEKGFHDKAQDAAHWRQSTEQLLNMNQPQPTGEEEKGASPEEFTQRLMTEPDKVLAERDERLASSIFTSMRNYLDTRDAVQFYLDENPDIKASGRLFAVHVQQTNPQAPIGDRLRLAGESTRSEIKRIREEGKKAAEFEDKQKREAADAGAGAHEGEKPKPEGKESGDSHADYLKDRKSDRDRIMGITP